MRQPPRFPKEGGFTMAEIMFSMAAFSMVSLGLLMAGSSLRRNASAVMDYSADHAAQMRISDSIAMDLRRSLSVTLSIPNNISIVIPEYMPTPAPSPAPRPTPYTPRLDANGAVYYGPSINNSTVTISYYLQNSSIYRLEGAASPVVLADNAEDFVFTPSAADNGKVIETTITFKPSFRSSGASTDAIAGTTFRNRTLLRNNVNVY